METPPREPKFLACSHSTLALVKTLGYQIQVESQVEFDNIGSFENITIDALVHDIPMSIPTGILLLDIM